MSEKTKDWVYEIRGSFIFDRITGTEISLHEAADRLNHSLKQSGIWAAKAGLITAERDEAVRERDELRAALKGLDLHYNSVMGLIKPMFGYQQYYWDKLIKEPKDAIRAALDALTTDKASAGGEA